MKKSKKILLILAMVLLVSTATFGIMYGISDGNFGSDFINKIANTLGIPMKEDDTNQDSAEEVTASDEATLRELLAAESNLIINVTDDMEVDEGFVVNGTKTLEGNATLRMSLGAELGQALLMISENSVLTLDGPILDCNYNSDGIHVAAKATLSSISGAIKRAGAYGILNYGEITIQDIDIEDCEYISICGQSGSELYMKGGSVRNSDQNHVYLVSGAYMNISGNTVMEQSYVHGMINYGTLEIHGGTFGNTGNYLCDNYGELTVAYEGNAEDGYIECYGAKRSAFLSRKGSTTNISDVYIHDTTRQAIASLGGDTTISNCKIENTGSHSIDIQDGKATIENVVVTNSMASGLETRAGVELTVTNFTVDGCKNIGIACRGAKITATQISINNTGKYGLSCGDSKDEDGILTVDNAEIKGTTKQSIYLYESGEGDFKNIQIAEGASRGVFLKDNASAKIHGKSTIKNMAMGGVEVRATLEMDSVVICDNHVKDRSSGAGVYVAGGGNLTMKNGAVYNNSTEVRGGGICVTDATITINGTKIHDNVAAKHGGGLYVQKKSVVNLNNGEITDNQSDNYGDGVYILSAESNVTMGENFYLGGNDVKLDNVKAVLHISGSNLKKHSASDPLLLTPNYDAKIGVQVAVCKNESVAKSLASKVKSGDGSYNIVRDNKYFAIEYAKADMDMTGAGTVYVSNYKELKEAVLNTVSKRNIVLKADIQMEARIRVPGGVTICIKDDGTKRTLSRAEGFTNSFFVTHYGTGLYLTGTDEGKLVLDGGYVASADATNNLPLVRVAGSTELRNVVLQNNGSLVKKNAVRGALLKQTYGDFKIYDSVLTGGKAYGGGAVLVQKGEGYIQGTVINGNESTVGGAGIRVESDCILEVVDSEFSGNHAGSTGGGICALGASKVTVTNSKFENNTATTHGGALSAQDKGTSLSVVGTDSASAIFKNNSSKAAGAIYIVKEADLKVSGYIFEGNMATNGTAGAISIIGNSTGTITNAAFYGNKSTGSGGALVADNSKVSIKNSEFGKENAGNEAGAKAGAVLVTGNAVATMTVEEDAKYNSMNYNTATGHGGAVYVNEGSNANISGYVFEGNKGAAGGAVFVEAGGNAVCQDNQYIDNTAISGETYGNGGAVYCAGTFKDTSSSYIGNVAKNGGAVIVMKDGLATLEGTNANALMQSNTATDKGGGAVYINAGGVATLTGYVLEDNAGTAGGAVYVAGSLTDLDSQYNNNTATGDGGAIVILSTGSATLNGTTFSGNQSGAAGGGLNIAAEATVTCENATFSKNKGHNGTAYTNGGAIYCAGTYNDKNSSYIENEARNGGAIFVPAGGNVTLVGTDSEKAVFENNQAMGATNSRGGAIFANKSGNIGGTICVTGYTFEGNTSTGTSANTGEGAVHVIDCCSVELKDVTFKGTTTQKVYVAGNLNFDNLSGAILVATAESSNFVVSGYQDGNVIELTPYQYVEGAKVVQKADEMKEENFQTACNAISVTQAPDGSSWYLNEEGKLVENIVASITVGGTTENFSTLNAAVDYANNDVDTAGEIVIVVLKDTCVNEKLEIKENKNIIIKADESSNETVTINRSIPNINMFYVNASGTLTIQDIVLDGRITSELEKEEGLTASTENLIICNGTLNLEDVTVQYAMRDNKDGGAIYLNADSAVVNLIGTSGSSMAKFENNTAIRGGAIFIMKGKVNATNYTFKSNKATGDGGAILDNASGSTYTNCTFSDNESGANGGAYKVHNRLSNPLFKGCVFNNNKANAGSAIYTNTGSATLINVTLHEGQKVYTNNNLTYNGLSADAFEGTSEGNNYVVASITETSGTTYYGNLSEAVAYVNEKGSTGTADALEIVVLENTSISATLEINKNTTIVNYSGKDVTINRGTQDVFDMFKVAADATLTLGTNDTSETGKLIIDGATTSAIGGRTVTVNVDAGFVLAKNTTLQNANTNTDEAKGAAVYTASADTYVYGTIKDNKTTKDCGGLYVDADAKATIEGATIIGNQGRAGGGLYIVAGATVTCENATFSGNKGLQGTTYGNGGAVYSAGTFNDKNSSYIGNEGKNGGAIIVMGGSVTLTGTDTTKALIQDNQGASNGKGGGAIYLNNGTLEVTGYIFEGNTSEGTTDSALYIVANRTATLSNVTFQGSTTQKVYVCAGGSLIKNNLTGATIVDENASATSMINELFATLSKCLMG